MDVASTELISYLEFQLKQIDYQVLESIWAETLRYGEDDMSYLVKFIYVLKSYIFSIRTRIF